MLRAVLVGMLREADRWGAPGAPPHGEQGGLDGLWATKGRCCPSGSDRDLAGTGPDLDVVLTFDPVVVGAPPVGLAAG